jgi:hypothetical protein
LLNFPGADADILRNVANTYLGLRNFAKSEQAISASPSFCPIAPTRGTIWPPSRPSVAEVPQALASLKKALDINADELLKDSKTANLRQHLFQDPYFATLRQTPEFKAAFGTKP